MRTFDFAQLEELWLNAGGSSSLEGLAAGTAIVESGGNSAAYNPSGASGLWQIEVPLHDNLIPGGAANVFNPADNAAAAVKLSGNTRAGIQDNWTDFEPAGAAAKIAAENGATVPATGALPGGSGSTSTAAANTASLAGATFNPLDPSTWLSSAAGSLLKAFGITPTSITDLLERGALMLLGAILMIVGVLRLSDTGSSAASPQPSPVKSAAEDAAVAAAA